MQSPFKIFRKYQKVALAALTLMAMIAFGLGDVIRQMGGGGRSQREGQIVFETNIGNVTESAIYRLTAERQTIHRFISVAFQRSHPEFDKSPYFEPIIRQVVGQFGFGGYSEFEMLYKWLYLREAQKMGVAVSDRQVEDYIDQFTNRKLSQTKFREILRDMRIGPKELFDIFREELEVSTAYRLTYPAPLPSPEKYWEYFQQLNTREKIAVAAVPVSSFTEKTGEPTEPQIATLFAKHQYDAESAFNGEYRPGFRQPQKVKLQYLEIAYADAEERARTNNPITDKDVEDYYEANKATTIWMQEPPPVEADEKTPIDPDMVPETGDGSDEKEGAGPKLDQPQQPDTDAQPEEAPGEPKPIDGGSGNVEPKDNNEKQPECWPGSDEDDAPGKSSDKQADGKEEDSNTSDSDSKDAKPQGTEEGSEEHAPKKTAAEQGSTDDNTADDKIDAPLGTKDKPKLPTPPEPKFKPLDDDLRSRIRDTLKTIRTEQLMKEIADNARKAMTTVAVSFADSKDIKLVDPDEKQLVELEGRAAAELRKIAEKYGMKFNQTGLVSDVELGEISGLGRAYDADSPMNFRGEMTTIIKQAFASDGLCQVFESEAFSSARYVSWKIRDVPAHVPNFKEPGIRDQVVAAWKRIEAQPLAKKRADELAQQARSSDEDFDAALKDETVTGSRLGSALAVFESGEFSFWQESTAPNAFGPSRQSQVQLGNPTGVAKPGRGFMQTVFDQLAEGEIGVALNDDASIYYVVKVLSRRPADREEFKTAKLFDRGSAYASIVQHDVQFALQQHDERIKERYAIRIKDIPRRTGRAMATDDE